MCLPHFHLRKFRLTFTKPKPDETPRALWIIMPSTLCPLNSLSSRQYPTHPFRE